ncbi:helicase PIF1 [Seminavis robusta]|uniref:ATP-dependent DNA helicase n=1 Tax=Seminavis robusta TaxID=568900 RepID=A0A9N8I1C0_9STRA|nr:helicase PIF1 [Seminavis robusta]|eukprot:Sro3363_g347230.1 helicase PIF1 (449) ;mRNA; r:4476-5822
MSGVAAVSIGGETTHSVTALNKQKASEDDIESWTNARLLIIDEVSFMNTNEVEKLDERLRQLRQRYTSLFGGIHILFCGDFRQLEPCTGSPLYSPYYSDKKWITSINCYIELFGRHRFEDDPEWGAILERIRNGNYTHHDIDAINECLLQPGTELPSTTSYCVYANRDRTAINAGIFHNLLKAHYGKSKEMPSDMIVVRASNMTRLSKSGAKQDLKNTDKHFIYENCPDHRVTAKKGRSTRGHFADPMLKLYYGLPLMLVTNEDVPNGHANGTRVILEEVVLCGGSTPKGLELDGMQCPSVEASQVDYLLCRAEDSQTKYFKIQPKTLTCLVKAPIPKHFGHTESTINFTVQLLQLPLLTNNAITGHKLQGQTKQDLLISTWSKVKNWNYVSLSRVKARAGLHLMKKLPQDVDFSVPEALLEMIARLETLLPEDLEWDLEEDEDNSLV